MFDETLSPGDPSFVMFLLETGREEKHQHNERLVFSIVHIVTLFEKKTSFLQFKIVFNVEFFLKERHLTVLTD